MTKEELFKTTVFAVLTRRIASDLCEYSKKLEEYYDDYSFLTSTEKKELKADIVALKPVIANLSDIGMKYFFKISKEIKENGEEVE